MDEPRIPRLRSGALPEDGLLAIRGLDTALDAIERDAQRFRRRYPDWQRYGISAFLAVDEIEIDVLCESRLERFPLVSIFTVGALRQAGLEVVPTFRRPHVTIAHSDLSSLIKGLSICEHRNQTNPFHQDDPRSEDQ